MTPEEAARARLRALHGKTASAPRSVAELSAAIETLRGPEGPPGPKGAPGPQGRTGERGPEGPKGDRGPLGPQGWAGDDGPAGPDGPRGPKGEKGDRGEKGEKGDRGPKGKDGMGGMNGPMGPAGPQGETGPAGSGGDTTAIETELGINPSGGYGSVAERLDAGRRTPVTALSATIFTVPGLVPISQATLALSANTDYYFPFHAEDYLTFDQLAVEVTVAATAGATGRIALTAAATNWQPSGTLIEDFGSFLIDSTGTKALAPAAATRVIPGARYLFVLNISAAATFRSLRGGIASMPLLTGASLFARLPSAARAHAAFPGTVAPWTAVQAGAVPCDHPILMRVTA